MGQKEKQINQVLLGPTLNLNNWILKLPCSSAFLSDQSKVFHEQHLNCINKIAPEFSFSEGFFVLHIPFSIKLGKEHKILTAA